MTLTSRRIREIEAVASDVLSEAYGEGIVFSPPIDLTKVVESQKLALVVGKFDRDDISGIFDRQESKIYVSEDEPYTRKAFTIAHELGHFILHKDKENEVYYRSDAQDLNRDGREEEETEANWFAASLLMPRDLVIKYKSVVSSTEELALIFGVSSTAMLFRLKNLGVL